MIYLKRMIYPQNPVMVDVTVISQETNGAKVTVHALVIQFKIVLIFKTSVEAENQIHPNFSNI